MNREQKASAVEILRKDFSNSAASFLVDYSGLTVVQMQGLRRTLRENKGLLRVSKARFMKIAVDGLSGTSELKPHLKNQIGVVFAKEEPSVIAKILSDFSKKNEALELLVGYLDAAVLDVASVKRIATLPSREILLAQVCGTLKAPTRVFVGLLNQLILRLLWVLKKIEESK